MFTRVLQGMLFSLGCVVALGYAAIMGCSGNSPEESLRHFRIEGLEGVLSRSGVEFDTAQSHDGNGSLRLTATAPTTFRLYELDDLDLDDAVLIYRAHLRSQDVQGKAYLEMWCQFPGKGEFFSRALHAPLTGTTEWTRQETPFRLEAGQNPDHVKLNLVIEGAGTVWIDDVVLAKGG